MLQLLLLISICFQTTNMSQLFKLSQESFQHNEQKQNLKFKQKRQTVKSRPLQRRQLPRTSSASFGLEESFETPSFHTSEPALNQTEEVGIY